MGLDFPNTEEVTGSNPVRPTTFFEILSSTESPNESQRPVALSRNRWPGRRLASWTRDVRQDAAGPRRSGTAFRWAWRGGRGADPGVVHDLPHRRRRDKVAEPDKLVLHPSVHHAGLSVAMRISSWRIAAAVDGRPDVGGSCNSHLRVTGRRRSPSSVAGVTANTSPHQRREPIATLPPAAAGRQARSGSVRHDGARRVSCRSTNSSGVHGYLVPGQHRQATYEQLDDRK